ncbi:MAG: 3-oxoacyl-[acyl-carrier-protein] reductase [Spirochaetales bacterium]|nr:3-oxoacyl-[acyl-carrier-protein] reductase [Spirochaetales bacterium]
MLLENKNALITGGARGIGKEIVLAFLREGASVYYIDLMEGDSMPEYQALAAKTGAKVVFREGNVADEEQITSVINNILAEAGTIEILVNNAGITRDGLVFRMSGKDWMDVININLSSAFYISKAISRAMIKQKEGSIINVSSIVGIAGNGGQCNYSASKAGLIGLTKSLAQEVGSRGVRVNAVAPGFIHSHMTDVLNEEQQKKMLEMIPMGRYGEPEEVAKVIVFLASDMASYVTSQVLPITGGMRM